MCIVHQWSQASGTAQQPIDFEVILSVHWVTLPLNLLYIDLHPLRAQSSISVATAPNES